jgi:glycosyltransferase involved in cell wall biosynthesis
MIKVSIIVPVFKVEDYINKCIDSLIRQSYKSIEIILVDDGSPDNCPMICDDYAKKEARIKVIHKKNGGLSDARNSGLKEATGDYVLFVDSDDYIDFKSVEYFIGAIGANRPQIVVGNARRIEKGRVILMLHKLNTNGEMMTGEEYLKIELKYGKMYMASWLNLYKRKYLLMNELRFKEGILHEDEQFTPRVFLKAEKVIGTDIIFYNYVVRDESITNKKDFAENAINIIRICHELEEIYDKVKDYELKRLLKDSLATKYLNAFQVGALYRKEYRYLLDKKFLRSLAYKRKTRLKVLMFNFNDKIYYNLNKIHKKFKQWFSV